MGGFNGVLTNVLVFYYNRNYQPSNIIWLTNISESKPDNQLNIDAIDGDYVTPVVLDFCENIENVKTRSFA